MAKRKRDYAKEYKASRRPDRRADNVSRKRARRKMERIHGKAKLKGKEIDHRDLNPRNNSLENLKISSVRANRKKQPKR